MHTKSDHVPPQHGGPYLERDRRGDTPTDIFRRLLKEERGITEYAFISGTSEGGPLPTGIESESWNVLTKDGTIHDLILDWDDAKLDPDGNRGYYTLHVIVVQPHEEVVRHAHTIESPYYIRARKHLGLPVTEAQETILRGFIEKWGDRGWPVLE